EVVDRIGGSGGLLGLERAFDNRAQRGGLEGFELEERRAAEERSVHLEERILGSRADKRENAFLDRGQQRVLLRLVESMDFVKEQDRAAVVLSEGRLGRGDGVAHVLDARA